MTYLDASDINAINSYSESVEYAEQEYNRKVKAALDMPLKTAFEYLKNEYSEQEAIEILASEKEWDNEEIITMVSFDEVMKMIHGYNRDNGNNWRKEFTVKKNLLAILFDVRLK